MRLRKKPWIGEALAQYSSFVYRDSEASLQGKWRDIFG